MAGGVVTNSGKKLLLNRGYKETPDYLEPSKFKVGTDSTAATVTDTDLGTAVEITAGVYTKDFESGYPSVDETNLQVEIRGRINTVEANGNMLAEFGIFNEDGTPLMESRDTFTGISKSSSDEIIFSIKTTLS